ncbi:E3 ubiquitin-protein ligase [Forsythia ovata]|uniref:E3 ubiquitin-protein ligase n=1 Tax=Forsythia ovata TaxID=205694 RepID=A0ABD1U993_9LAMI
MAGLSQILAHIYTTTLVFFSILFLELVILVRAAVGTIHGCKNRPITTTQYLKLVEDKNPACRYKTGLRMESLECAVCLSIYEEGDEIRKLRKCNHTFHKDCLDTWLQQDWATCPLCRSMVLPEEVVFNYRRHQNEQEFDGSDEELIFLLSALHGSPKGTGGPVSPYNKASVAGEGGGELDGDKRLRYTPNEREDEKTKNGKQRTCSSGSSP